MKGTTVMLCVLVCLLSQAGGNMMPLKEDLCGLIVDTVLEEDCLECFTEAGNISQHPEEVRYCVATYLPPLAADCAVPHPDRALTGSEPRIIQGPPPTHHNHTNANLLPLCLRRRMRTLSRYLRRENQFTSQAGSLAKRVISAKIIPDGGPTMLSIGAVQAIISIPQVKTLVKKHASGCVEQYGAGKVRRGGVFGELREGASQLTTHLDPRTDKKSWKEVLGGDNSELPFRGANSLTREVLLAKCIINSLIDNGVGMKLIQVIKGDSFFFPIPEWWVEPLLRFWQTTTRMSE